MCIADMGMARLRTSKPRIHGTLAITQMAHSQEDGKAFLRHLSVYGQLTRVHKDEKLFLDTCTLKLLIYKNLPRVLEPRLCGSWHWRRWRAP